MEDKDNYKPLKNERAEKLRKRGVIKIGDMEVKLWQKQTAANIKGQFGWDAIRSLSKYNAQSSGRRGTLVVSGTFQIPRAEVLELATRCGFKIASQVTVHTDIIAIGSENVSPNKIATALELVEKGFDIKFVDENEFLMFLGNILDKENRRNPNKKHIPNEPSEEDKSVIKGCIIWIVFLAICYLVYRIFF